MTPAVGALAPGFTLPSHDGDTVSLAGFRGSRWVLLVFFPFAFHAVCREELAAVRDRRDELGSDVVVLAVACDAVMSLRALARADALDFPLLSDFWPHGAVAEAYGVLLPGKGFPTRGSFLIDPGGVLRWSGVNPPGEPRAFDDYAEALASARSA